MRRIGTFWQRNPTIAPAYGQAIWFAIKQQAILAILAALVLDMGQTAAALAAIIIGYWVGAAVIVARRPMSPSKVDLIFVRWGCALLAAACMGASLVHVIIHG